MKKWKTENLDLWEPTSENRPWKLAVQNSVRPADPENRLTESFSKFWKPGQFSEWEIVYKNEEPGRFSEPAPQNRNRRFSQKVRTAQHCS